MVTIISDKQQEEYTGFITETLNTFQNHNIRGIAIVALTDDETLTGYWNMNLRDKATAENEIRYDVLDEFILNNKDRYAENEE